MRLVVLIPISHINSSNLSSCSLSSLSSSCLQHSLPPLAFISAQTSGLNALVGGVSSLPHRALSSALLSGLSALCGAISTKCTKDTKNTKKLRKTSVRDAIQFDLIYFQRCACPY